MTANSPSKSPVSATTMVSFLSCSRLDIFGFFASLGLIVSVGTGLYSSYRQHRREHGAAAPAAAVRNERGGKRDLTLAGHNNERAGSRPAAIGITGSSSTRVEPSRYPYLSPIEREMRLGFWFRFNESRIMGKGLAMFLKQFGVLVWYLNSSIPAHGGSASYHVALESLFVPTPARKIFSISFEIRAGACFTADFQSWA